MTDMSKEVIKLPPMPAGYINPGMSPVYSASMMMAYAEQAVREALAEQPAPATELREQEPVVWLKHGPYEDGEPLSVVFEDPNDDVCYSPLGFIDNTSPPAQRTWVGLTFGEVSEIFQKMFDVRADWPDFADAIEAKLKEKNT